MPPMRTSNVQVRPAHTSGPTFLCYNPNGRKLITVGANNTIRVFETGSSSEPANIDDSQDSNTAVVASNDFFITGSEDGSVCKYSFRTQSLEEILTRCTLPIRDVALSPDAQWVAAASEEHVVKVINTNDSTRVLFLRDQAKPSKHLSFDQSGSFLAITCIEGSIYIYSMQPREPKLVKRIDGVAKMLSADQQASSMIAWHPDNEVFATPYRHRGIRIVSKSDWADHTAFDDEHTSDITAMAWSPNGGFLVTSASDMKICLWDSTTQKLIYRIEDLRTSIWAFAWHPTENILAYTNSDGELHIHSGFVPSTHLQILDESLVPYNPKKNTLNQMSGEVKLVTQRTNKTQKIHNLSSGQTTDSINDIARFNELAEFDDDLFVEDDDGVGYAESTNEYGKRSLDPHDENYRTTSKRQVTNNTGRALIHPSFQPGSTPWRGNRRYLCLNLVGSVWVIKQGEHNIVTVEFNDREVHRDFHFTELVEYDKACLNEKGILLSSMSLGSIPATIFYRPHETWTTRSEWRMNFRKDENVTAIALSESFIVVTTTKNYVRVYTLFGTPIRLYRHKSCPLVACVAWRDYVLTVANGPMLANGMPALVYSIISLRQDKICQDEDTIALRENSKLHNVFFSDSGDPYIYDSDGVLLVLQHWRVPGQARWIPLLDMNDLRRVADGRKEESYWPLGVAQNKFYCIILKGAELYPYFPRPLLSEFDFKIPLASNRIHTTTPETDSEKLEEFYVRTSVLHSLQKDLITSTNATQAQKVNLGQKALEIDKLLLQLLAVECVESEEQGMKALELVNLMRDGSGRMLEAAGKIAARFGRHVLGEKIQELAERRLVGQGDSFDDE